MMEQPSLMSSGRYRKVMYLLAVKPQLKVLAYSAHAVRIIAAVRTLIKKFQPIGATSKMLWSGTQIRGHPTAICEQTLVEFLALRPGSLQK